MVKNSSTTEAGHKQSLDTYSYWSIHVRRKAPVSLLRGIVTPIAWILLFSRSMNMQCHGQEGETPVIHEYVATV